MPFHKIAENKYRSPSGRIYTRKQVRLYYANDGFPKDHKKRGKRSR